MSQSCKQIIEDLFPMNRCLLGEGYDNALKYIHALVPLEVFEFPSGTEVGTWTVPDEWVIRDGWVKYKGKKIIDYKDQPLSVVVGSLPVNKTVGLEELKLHLHYSDEMPSHHLYEYKLSERDWGFTMPKHLVYKKEGEETVEILEEGDYEVFIDSEYRPGVMKVGVHTIMGKTDREVLLIAHLDHPFQANDNLSGVACLIDLVKKIKPLTLEHTIKLVFCPETIGSIAYATTANISNVDFVIALDAIGNKNEQGILLQKSFKREERVNDCAHLALRGTGEGFRQGNFRGDIGSDEYVFNDPHFNIPGVLLTTHPYMEYHTSADTPDIIDYAMIEKVQRVIIKTIEYYEQDAILSRNFDAPLFRSRYGIQTKGKDFNRSWDYLIYSIDNERVLSRLCIDFGLNFEHTREQLGKLITDGKISSRPVAR